MKRKRILAIALSLILVMVSATMLFACNKKYTVTFKEKGSKVFAIKSEDVPTPVVDTFTTYDEYKSSKYADMKLGGFDAPTKDIFFDKHYFNGNNLIAVKFNDYADVSHFVERVGYTDEDHYYVDMVRLNSRDRSYTNSKVNAYVCFLEMPKDRDIKGAKVKLNVTDRYILSTAPGKSILTSDDPLKVSTINSYEDFNAYYQKVDAKTQSVLNEYSQDFFKDSYILVVDYYFDSDNIATISESSHDWLLDIHVYASNHFRTNMPRQSRIVRYVPIPRSRVIDKINLYVYHESNFGESNESNKVYEVKDLAK